MCFDIVKLTFYSVLTLLVPNTRNINLKKKKKLKNMGRAYVQCKFSLDTSRFGHVSKSGHLSVIQRVQ